MGTAITVRDIKKAVNKLKENSSLAKWTLISTPYVLNSNGTIGSLFGVNFMVTDYVGDPEWVKEFERRIQC
jgi:hypothetical protein